MQNIPAPTKIARRNGGTVKLTEWTSGAYTLRKSESDDYAVWTVRADGHRLPRIQDNSPNQTPDFGVSCYSESGMSPAGAVAYAGQIMEAAQAALAFNMIVAAS